MIATPREITNLYGAWKLLNKDLIKEIGNGVFEAKSATRNDVTHDIIADTLRNKISCGCESFTHAPIEDKACKHTVAVEILGRVN